MFAVVKCRKVLRGNSKTEDVPALWRVWLVKDPCNQPLRSHFPAFLVWVSAGSTGPGEEGGFQAGFRESAWLFSGLVKVTNNLLAWEGRPQKWASAPKAAGQ